MSYFADDDEESEDEEDGSSASERDGDRGERRKRYDSGEDIDDLASDEDIVVDASKPSRGYQKRERGDKEYRKDSDAYKAKGRRK